MLPDHLQQFEGLVICCIVIVGLLTMVVVSFVFAYFLKWERLMTQIRIQKDNVSRKKTHSNGMKVNALKHIETAKLTG